MTKDGIVEDGSMPGYARPAGIAEKSSSEKGRGEVEAIYNTVTVDRLFAEGWARRGLDLRWCLVHRPASGVINGRRK